MISRRTDFIQLFEMAAHPEPKNYVMSFGDLLTCF